MNCIEYRRQLLADPGTCTHEQEEHLVACPACAAFAREARRFEADLHDAISVPPPKALAERILSRRRGRAPALYMWAIAASLLIGVGLGFYLYDFLRDGEEPVHVAAELGDRHPAVAAIAYVVDHEARLLAEGQRGDEAVLRATLERLGMRIPKENVSIRYLGKCPVAGGTGEHVVLTTPAGQVTLILVPERTFGPRVIVADRDRMAISSPRRAGGYVLVADRLERLRKAEQLLM